MSEEEATAVMDLQAMLRATKTMSRWKRLALSEHHPAMNSPYRKLWTDLHDVEHYCTEALKGLAKAP